MRLAQGAAPQADEGMGENRHGGTSAEGRMRRIPAREGVVSGIADHGQADAAERIGGGSLRVLRVSAALTVVCGLIVAPVTVALAATQSIIALPDDTPDVPPPPALSAPPAAHPLPPLPTREIVPRELHAPDESAVETVRPIELYETVKTPAPRAVEKRQRSVGEAPPAQSAAVAGQPSPPVPLHAALPAASTQPPPSGAQGQAARPDDQTQQGQTRQGQTQQGQTQQGQTQQGQFAEHTPPTAPAVEAPTAPVSDLVATLIRRGDELLQLRDIAGARLLYERAALSGNAHAAMLAGKTYDPLYFTETGISGIAPDRAKAMEWYGAATALGDAEATSRAERLRGVSKQ
jgi:hypothetical protein